MKVNRFQSHVNIVTIIILSFYTSCCANEQEMSAHTLAIQQALDQELPSQSATRSFRDSMHAQDDQRAVVLGNHKPKQESRTSVFQESFMKYLREIYNQRDYPTALSQDGSHILQFMELSNELNLGPETVYVYMRLFKTKACECEIIDYAMLLDLLGSMPELLERHFITNEEDEPDRIHDLSFIKHQIESSLLTKFTQHLPTFQTTPDVFLSDLAHDLASYCQHEIHQAKKDQETATARERLRQIIIRFFDTILNKLMWTADNGENPWKAFTAIADGLMALAENGIINHMDDLDELFRSLTNRFCFYLDLAGASIPLEIYDDIESDLEEGLVPFLEWSEQDEGITSKKEALWESVAQARTRAFAYTRSGIISMPMINQHEDKVMNTEVLVGKIYQHYSGKEYRVLGCSRHSETLEEMVVYQGMYDCPTFGPNPLWVRPKSMFNEEVLIDGVATPRFKIKNLQENP